MPVFSANRSWPFPRIPYKLVTGPDAERIQGWVDGLNAQIGYDLLQAHRSEPSWLMLKIGSGKSESIGYMSGETVVTASKVDSMHHEIMHALGFHHEQYHSLFPWNDADAAWRADPTCWNHLLHKAWASEYESGLRDRMELALGTGKKTGASRSTMGSMDLETGAKPRGPAQSSSSLGALGLDFQPASQRAPLKPLGPLKAFGTSPALPKSPAPSIDFVALQATKTAASNVQLQLDARTLCVTDPHVEHSDAGSDLDAVMMYPEAMRAAVACYTTASAAPRMPADAGRFGSGRCQLGSKTLSNAEVAAIRMYYPSKAKQD